MSNDASLLERYNFACEVAAAAARHTLAYFQQTSVSVEKKTDRSPVTRADREAEELLRERIGAAFPDDGIVGEEYGVKEGRSPYRWVLDPIDGTRTFICGVPLFGTLIGLQRDNMSVAGVIEVPGLGESVHACIGHGAWHCRRGEAAVPARVSNCDKIEEAVFLFSDPMSYVDSGRIEFLQQMQRRCYTSRTWGDCYGYLLVATGRADIMLDPSLQIWDAAPMIPIMQEAGGIFTDWQGRASVESREGAAGNAKLLHQVLAFAKEFPYADTACP